jgi:hypothetical protein
MDKYGLGKFTNYEQFHQYEILSYSSRVAPESGGSGMQLHVTESHSGFEMAGGFLRLNHRTLYSTSYWYVTSEAQAQVSSQPAVPQGSRQLTVFTSPAHVREW